LGTFRGFQASRKFACSPPWTCHNGRPSPVEGLFNQITRIWITPPRRSDGDLGLLSEGVREFPVGLDMLLIWLAALPDCISGLLDQG
jgi:hypothetical protein